MPRVINKIIIHCSDSGFGDAALIEDWHKERKIKSIGYHYVILNGVHKSKAPYLEDSDGIIQDGRHLDLYGAHCAGENKNSIGICLIGKAEFTEKQLAALKQRVLKLMEDWQISVDNVLGHYETKSGGEQGKTCPNIDMATFRAGLQ